MLGERTCFLFPQETEESPSLLYGRDKLGSIGCCEETILSISLGSLSCPDRWAFSNQREWEVGWVKWVDPTSFGRDPDRSEQMAKLSSSQSGWTGILVFYDWGYHRRPFKECCMAPSPLNQARSGRRRHSIY